MTNPAHGQPDIILPLIVVSGLPRSGTSMMMAMLNAGGLEVLTDGARGADDDNPRGYFEYAPVKRMAEDVAWTYGAGGKAVKIVSSLLREIPAALPCKVIFMERALPEILASQRQMLVRREEVSHIDDTQLARIYEKHLAQVGEWLGANPNVDVLQMEYGAVLAEPRYAACQINAFLNNALDVDAMAAVVDPRLQHQRS